MTSEIFRALDNFFTCYLTRRDREATLNCVSDEIISLGTGAQEVALDKKEFRQLLLAEFSELPTSIKYTIVNYREKNCQSGSSCIIFCNVIAELTDENGDSARMETRLTASFCRNCADCDSAATNETMSEITTPWLITSLHLSTATVFQEEDEFFPLRYGQSSVSKISTQTKQNIMDLMKEVIPGGIMGGYLEPGFPLYVINDEMLGYLGYSFDELISNTNGLMSNTIHPDDRQMVYDQIMASLTGSDDYVVDYRLLQKNGSYIWVHDKGRKIETEDGRFAIISVIMYFRFCPGSGTLRREAGLDPLTQILNRREGIRLIEYAINRKQYGILMVIDIDNFKLINDKYGHQAGDEVLQTLAGFLHNNVRHQDIAARLGGDEFMVYLTDFDVREQAVEKIEHINKLLAEHFAAQFADLIPSISTGLAGGTVNEDFKQLFKRADLALYKAKKQKRGSCCWD
jgi:diguanylate cyclase (GGDEF)-like protein/PAS domain S-box-containing protein